MIKIKRSVAVRIIAIIAIFIVTITAYSADLVIVSVSVCPNTISEGGPDGAIVFTRSGGTSQPLTVNFSIPEATQMARAVEAPLLASRSITIPAGAASSTATVHAVDDSEMIGNGTTLMTVTLK